MPSISNLIIMPRRLLPVFFLIDTANNEKLGNKKYSIINHFMKEAASVLVECKNSKSAEIKVAVMEFDTDYRWMSENGLVGIEEFGYSGFEFENDEQPFGKKADIRAVLVELNNRLNRKEFLDSIVGVYRPIIIWITDGNIVENYEQELDELNDNNWYKNSYKIGVRIGNDSNIDALSKIVGNDETIIKTTDFGLLYHLIREAITSVSMADKNDKYDLFERISIKFDEYKLCEIQKGAKYSVCKCQIKRCEPNEALNTVINITSEDTSGTIMVRHELDEYVILVRKGAQCYDLGEENLFPDYLRVKGMAKIEISDGTLHIKSMNNEVLSAQMFEIKETMEKSKDYTLRCGDRMELQCGTVYFTNGC